MASAAAAAIGSSGVGASSSSHNLTPIMFSVNVNQNASSYAASLRRGGATHHSNNNNNNSQDQQANQPKQTWRQRILAVFKGSKPKVRGDPLDYDISLPRRYVPTSVEELVERTKFTREEVKRLYCSWKQFCPYGLVDREQFIACFSDLYPYGNCRSYAGRVFDALITRNDSRRTPSVPQLPMLATTTVILPSTSSSDVEAETRLIPVVPPLPPPRQYDFDYEEIDFESFIVFLSCVLRGSDEEKLDWCFQLYDRDNEGRLTQKNVVEFVFSIYQLVNEEPEKSSVQYDAIYQQAVRTYQVRMSRLITEPSNWGAAIRNVLSLLNMVQKLDVRGKGFVTRKDFIAVCMHNDVIRQSLQVFDTII